MQVQVKRLRSTLDMLEPVVPKKPTLPVLANILLKDGRAYANNLEVAVALELPEAEGQCLLPAGVAEVLRRVPGDEMLSLEQRGKTLHLAWPAGKASFEATEPQEYPPFPKVEAKASGTVDGDTLVPVLLWASDYCAADKDRPVLTGVTLALGQPMEVAAGDGFRMAYRSLPLSWSSPSSEGEDIRQVVIPAGAIRTLGRLWEKLPRTAPTEQSLIRVVTARRQLELMVGDGRLEARFGPVALVAQLVEGTPPKWRQLIPQETPQKVRAFGPDLERAVRQMREVAGKSGVVRLTWSEATLTVRAKGEETGEVETTVSVETQGEPGRVALKASYLLDYLRGKEGMVTMGVTTPTGPVLLRHGPSSEGLVLVMPMQVQW